MLLLSYTFSGRSISSFWASLIKRYLLLILTCAVFSGCSSFGYKPIEVMESTGEHSDAMRANQKALQAIQNWQAKGKMKISIANQSHSASFDWQQFKQNYSINFFGPLGYGSTWLRRTSRGVTLQAPDQPTIQAPNPESLLERALGWQVPVSDLQYWMLGMPSPLAPSAAQPQTLATWQALPSGALTHLIQQGWKLEFSRHQQYGSAWLPSRITATRKEASLLVIIKEWQPK